MKNRDNIFVFSVVGIFVILGVFIAWNSKDKVNWEERLDQQEKQPYDLGYFKSILQQSNDQKFEVLDNALEKSLANRNGYNYFLVGSASFYSDKDFEALEKFVRQGNDAFISVKFFDDKIKELVEFLNESSVLTDSIFRTGFEGNEEKPTLFRFFDKQGRKKVQLNYIEYYEDEYDPEKMKFLAYIQQYSPKRKKDGYVYYNYAQIKLGKGNVYIHTNPILFSNAQLQQKSGLNYANEVLSQLNRKPILWDEYSSHFRFESNSSNPTTISSPLQFILKNDALKTAWYTLLVGILIFLLFRSKRKQKRIPIIPQLENSSLEFSRSLGALYIQTGSAKSLALELMSLFDNYNRRRYRIHRNKKDLNFSAVIAKKSRVDQTIVQKILNLERNLVYNPNATLKDVMPLYEAIKEYYNKTKR